MNYHNEFDPKAAAWLRELIHDGQLPAGDVDERDIRDVKPGDLKGYAQCHWFCGIGGWPLALRLAGVPDHWPGVWTGSPPCQPFSEAGAGRGMADERHLWPYLHYLIQVGRPGLFLGEQVEAAIRYGWLDLVRADLEGEGYAFAAVGLPAACVGAPHIRQRLFFVADTDEGRSGRDAGGIPRAQGGAEWGVRGVVDGAQSGSAVVGPSVVGDTERPGLAQRVGHPGVPGRPSGAGARQAAVGAGVHALPVADGGQFRPSPGPRVKGAPDGSLEPQRSRASEPVADADGRDAGTEREQPGGQQRFQLQGIGHDGWDALEWLACRDGKFRPTQPGLLPLAYGVPHRVGLLRGSGNAIVPQVAAAFIQEYLTVRSLLR